ncbi:MAG: hypothetical protein Tsb0034_04670 [Ekhidna sp.]
MVNTIGKILTNITEYIEIKTEQIKLRLIGKIAKLFSGLISLTVIFGLGMFFLLFFSFASANLINHHLDSVHLGYWIVGSFYFLMMAIVFLLVKTKRLQGWLEDLIVKLSEKEDEKEH